MNVIYCKRCDSIVRGLPVSGDSFQFGGGRVPSCECTIGKSLEGEPVDVTAKKGPSHWNERPAESLYREIV